jgi:hypothetical protein
MVKLLEIWGHSIMVMDSVFPDGPVVQIKRVGVRMLHEEEGTDDNSVKIIKLKHEKEARILNNMYIMSA